MSVDILELQRRFSRLTDEALLAVNADELVDAARQCLEAEVATRGLRRATTSISEAPAEPSDLNAEGLVSVAAEDEAPQGDWALLEEFDSAEQVQVTVSLLRSAGIPFHTPLQNSSTNSLVGLPEGAFRVFVPADALEDAQLILDSPISEEELAAQAEAAAMIDEDPEDAQPDPEAS